MKVAIIIAIVLLCGSIASLGTGITLLVKRYHMEAPQHYRDESINYSERLPKSTSRIVVAKDDVYVMAERVKRFIKRNGGEVDRTTREFNARWITASVPLEVHRHIASLHKDGYQLSSGYAYWPGPWQKSELSHDLYRVKVKIRGVEYHKKMLDIGMATVIAGGVMLVAGLIALACAYDCYDNQRRRSA